MVCSRIRKNAGDAATTQEGPMANQTEKPCMKYEASAAETVVAENNERLPGKKTGNSRL
jgi:hypothetical protein